MTTRRNESGMALISVLMLISTMSLFALIIIDSVRFATRTSINFANNHQMRLFAESAETVIHQQLKMLMQDPKDKDALLNRWVNSQFSFEIPDGVIEVQVSDGSHCFNINSIVEINEEVGLVASEQNSKVFERLLIELGIDENSAKSITAEAIDWIDTDDQAVFRGAEDDYYVALDNPYRTARTLMADVSELHSLRSMTPEIYEHIRPYLCTDSTVELVGLNVNTLKIEKSPLIAAYLGGELTTVDVINVFRFSPLSNYTSTREYFESQNIDTSKLRDGVTKRFATSTKIFHVNTVIRYKQSVAETWVEFAVSTSNEVTKTSWRFGTIE